jgi:hypothetical protein
MTTTRFHVMLEQRQHDYLSGEAERMSVSVAELIRRAIDHTYGLSSTPRADGVELSVAIWRRPDAAVIGRRPGIRFRR